MPISLPNISTLINIEGRFNTKGEPTVRNATYGKIWTVACAVSCVALVALTVIAPASLIFGSMVLHTVNLSAPLGILQISIGLLLLTTALPKMVRLALESYKNAKYHGGTVQISLEKAYLDFASKKIEYEFAERAVADAENEIEKAAREYQECQKAQASQTEAIRASAEVEKAKKELEALKAIAQKAKNDVNTLNNQVGLAKRSEAAAQRGVDSADQETKDAQKDFDEAFKRKTLEEGHARKKAEEVENHKKNELEPKKQAWEQKVKALEDENEKLRVKRDDQAAAKEKLRLLSEDLTIKKTEKETKESAAASDKAQAVQDAAAQAVLDYNAAKKLVDDMKNPLRVLQGEVGGLEKSVTLLNDAAEAAKKAFESAKEDNELLVLRAQAADKDAKAIGTKKEADVLADKKEVEKNKRTEHTEKQKLVTTLDIELVKLQALEKQKELEVQQKENVVKNLESDAQWKKNEAEKRILLANNLNGQKTVRVDQINVAALLDKKKSIENQKIALSKTLKDQREDIFKYLNYTETGLSKLKSLHTVTQIHYQAASNVAKEAQKVADKAVKEKAADAPQKVAIAKSLAFEAALAAVNHAKELDQSATKEGASSRGKELKAAADKFKKSEDYTKALSLVNA